jgi:hypothetical protein
MNVQNYSKAAYCYEEVLAKEPRNYLVNLRYAELLFSLTSKPQERQQDLLNARKYFSHAAILKEGAPDSRTLFGLLKTCLALDKVNKKEDTKNTEMIEVTKKQIKDLYAAKAPKEISQAV